MDEHACARLCLVGGGGEKVDIERTFKSHGVASLPPNLLAPGRLTTTVRLPDGSATTIRVESLEDSVARVSWAHAAGSVGWAERLVEMAGRILRLDDDLSDFYRLAALDADLSWVADGAGRMLCSPTVFEDLVKTICTTNCSWSATERMVAALVEGLGTPAADGRRAFPGALEMAEAPTSFYSKIMRAGYRGRYLSAVSRLSADGGLDLERLRDPEMPDDEVERCLIALPGVGPYAAAHLMLTGLGRHHKLVLDSWTMPTWARLSGSEATPAAIEARFRRFGRFQGLAFWLYLTRDWVAD